LSSNPNFQNITKNVKEDEKDADGYRHPAFVKWLPLLPSLRMYILPDRGQMFGHRDFCQQELRILAEFEDADLFRMYRANPDLDVHELVQGLLADAGKPLERGQVKGFNFGILYGMGATGLSRRLGVSKGEARNLITTWNNVMPGVATLVAELKEEVRGGGEIVTWGGRRYGMPPPMWEGDEQRDRDYVLLNYLIQGSGADATKRAMIEFYKRKRESRIIVNVHDEINFSCPKGAMAQEQKILKKVIEDLKFDVGMKSDGTAGKCWGDMTKWKD
jgi:DNA polymerase-1